MGVRECTDNRCDKHGLDIIPDLTSGLFSQFPLCILWAIKMVGPSRTIAAVKPKWLL
jgi:hypothetical protein